MGRPHPALLDLAAGRDPRGAIEDVSALLASAQEHRMTGLVARWVNNGTLPLPRDQAVRLATYNLRVRAHHDHLWKALASVTDEFAGIGIEVASFKGVTAEARWYDGLGERPCADLDLLLSPSHINRIEDIIAHFQPSHPLAGKAQMMAEFGQIQHVDLRGVEDVDLDLHFDLLKILIPGRHQEEIWQRTTGFDGVDHGAFKVVDPETSLIQSLLHLTKDRFSLLLGFVDVVRIIEREDLDWNYIDRFVREEGLEVPTYLALAQVFETLDLSAPSIPGVRGWRTSMWRLIWGPSTQLQGAWGRVTHHRRQFWIPLLARGRLTEAMRRLTELAFPPRALMTHYHPNIRGPYLWHLLRGRLRRAQERRREALDARRV
ncbi:MAG: nucleotidyltransferase family protein [Acidimicrobiia bacterium]